MISIMDLRLPRLVWDWPDTDSVEHMELVDSIKAHGILMPLTAYRRKDDRIEIIDGLRRFLVASELGIESIPCSVVEADRNEALLLHVRLNADHRPAKEFVGPIRAFLRRNPEMTIAGLSQRLHKAPSFICEALSLGYLDDETRTHVHRGEIPLQSAYLLCKLIDKSRFIDLARALSAERFKPIVCEAIRTQQGERRSNILRRNYPTEFKVRTWLRQIDDVRSELETSEAGARLTHESMTPLDAWKAAIRWVLNCDDASAVKQRAAHARRGL